MSNKKYIIDKETAECSYFIVGKSVELSVGIANACFAIDMNNLPEGSAVFNARHLSAAHVGKGGSNSTDFSQPGVLRNSLSLFNAKNGLPLTRDHIERYNNTAAVIGKVGEGKYTNSRTNPDGIVTPAGIDAPIIINQNDFPEIVNLIKLKALAGISVTLRFKFRLSHDLNLDNGVDDFDDFLEKVGTIAPDGREYHYIATEILEYKASSLVLYQADPDAIISFSNGMKLSSDLKNDDIIDLPSEIKYFHEIEKEYNQKFISFQEEIVQKNTVIANLQEEKVLLLAQTQKDTFANQKLVEDLAVLQEVKKEMNQEFARKKGELLAFTHGKPAYQALIDNATTVKELHDIAKVFNTNILDDYGWRCPNCNSSSVNIGHKLVNEENKNTDEINVNS